MNQPIELTHKSGHCADPVMRGSAAPTPHDGDLRVRPSGTQTLHRLALSVVVPCFNEARVLPETHRRLTDACAAEADGSYEIIYVDDGSHDATWPILNRLADSDPHVVGVALSRNFGHQLALSAGLTLARGNRILMIDADLQDPPELLGRMMTVLDNGADVAYGLRTERAGETKFKVASASLFYRLLNLFSDVRIPENAGDFRLISRRVLDALLEMPEQHRFVRGLIAWLGFEQVPVPYSRAARFSGETKYPLSRMMRLAFDAVTGFSIRPLRISILFAIASFGLALAIFVYAFISWYLGSTVRGWASLIIVVALFSGLQLLSLGIIGEYLGRMFVEAKRRPLFILREVRIGKQEVEGKETGATDRF